MTYSDYTAGADIKPGDKIVTVLYGESRYGKFLTYNEFTVLAVEENRVQVVNPDGGNYRSNCNRSARTRWYKKTSPILANAVIAKN
jgi:hypothetical protein